VTAPPRLAITPVMDSVTRNIPPASLAPSDRFQEKRTRILEAAAAEINARGLKGLTLVGVADAVGLNTTSVTYYFKRKEILAAETLQHAILRYGTIIRAAADAPTVDTRLHELLALFFDLFTRIRLNQAQPLTNLSDLRALKEPMRSTLIQDCITIVTDLATALRPDDGSTSRALDIARAQVLLEAIRWAVAWLPQYSAADFPRVQARMYDLLAHGFAPKGAIWAPTIYDIDGGDAQAGEISRETFLRAATHLINERGYRGSSVERIAAELNVSKGSFYHHLKGKDDLVLACFDRSYARVSRAQRIALDSDDSAWTRITSSTASLLEVQFNAEFPLLRTTALQALPADLRGGVLRRSNRMAQRFAGMMVDGMAEGTIRHIDPMIASQCLISSLNAAIDFLPWAKARRTREDAIHLYGSVLTFGILGKPPLLQP